MSSKGRTCFHGRTAYDVMKRYRGNHMSEPIKSDGDKLYMDDAGNSRSV